MSEDERSLTVTYHVYGERSMNELAEERKRALGHWAPQARFRYFLKRRNPRPEWYARYDPPGTRFYRDTRGLPFFEAGPAYEMPDGSEWIVVGEPGRDHWVVYRYSPPGAGEYSGSDGWDLD